MEDGQVLDSPDLDYSAGPEIPEKLLRRSRERRAEMAGDREEAPNPLLISTWVNELEALRTATREQLAFVRAVEERLGHLEGLLRVEIPAQLSHIHNRINEEAMYVQQLLAKVNRWEPLVEEMANRQPAKFKQWWTKEKHAGPQQ